MQSPVPRKPEIMSPAGYWPQLHAAIEAGADAVYFGLKHFSARAKTGFSVDELPQVMRTLHARGVRGFVTFNTLVFEHELLEAARAIAAIVEAGADAMIVQDYGIVRLIRRRALASTASIWHENCRSMKSGRSLPARIAKPRSLSTGRYAWLTQDNVFRPKRGEGAVRIGGNALKRAGCRTRCWSMDGCSP